MNSATKKLRFLFVSPVSPLAPGSGAEQRSNAIWQALLTLGEVDVLQLSHGSTTTVVQQQIDGQPLVVAELASSNLSLRRYAPKTNFTKRIESCTGHAMGEYDLIVGRYVWPVCQLDIPQHVPVMVDLDDWCFRTSSVLPASWQMLTMRLKKWLSHRGSKRQLYRFSAAWVVSDLDRFELSGLPVQLLHNVPAGSSIRPGPVPASGRVLFVGSLWYEPNIEGVEWFLRHVWPKVVKFQPSATLTLVGAAPADLRARWCQHPGVEAPGFVTDLADIYDRASLVVVPIRSGGGSNIKLLEALKHGRPCVATSLASGAFASQLQADVHLMVADESEEFADKSISVLRNPASFQHVVDAGLREVGAIYTQEVFASQVNELVRKTLTRRSLAQ